jgi:hypothetical protein
MEKPLRGAAIVSKGLNIGRDEAILYKIATRLPMFDS